MTFSLKNTPTLLTLLRIAIIPLLVIVYYLPWGHVTATLLFFIACVTDWLDGYLARALNVSTPLGAFLDPVADKLLVAVALIVVLEHIAYLAVPAAVIIGREIVVSALREWMAEMGKRSSVAVTYVSKIKTALQMVALGFLLAASPHGPQWILIVGYTLIYLAAALTIWTMLVYIKLAWGDIKRGMDFRELRTED